MNELDMIQKNINSILQRNGVAIEVMDNLVIDLTLYIQNAWIAEAVDSLARNQALVETQQELRELRHQYKELEKSYIDSLNNLALISVLTQEQNESDQLFLMQEEANKKLGVKND